MSMSIEARVVDWLAQQEVDAYLVGGWVRDRWLGRPLYDIDVAVAGDGLVLARRLADHFQGAYYPLATARSTGRAILSDESGRRVVVDVARQTKVDTALTNSFGFGGHNSVLILRRFTEANV